MTMRWSEEELEYLKQNISKEPQKVIAINIGRTTVAVRNKCYELGLVDRSNLWTEQEVILLKEFYEKAGKIAPINLKKLADTLNRDKANVCRKAKDLGLGTSINRRQTEEAKVKCSVATRNRIQKYGHNKGMLGKKHTDKFKREMSDRVKKEWENPHSLLNSEAHKQKQSDAMTERLHNDPRFRRGYSRGKQGKRPDLNNMYFRSSWEANYARYLNLLKANGKIHKWEFEPDTFWFETIKRGTRSYLPDFKIWENENAEPYYVEVKGWMDAKSKTKLDRMKRYYPQIKVIVFGASEYKELKKSNGVIPNWE